MTKLKYQLAHPALMWTLVIAGGIGLWQIAPKGTFFDYGQLSIAFLIIGIVNWCYLSWLSWKAHKKPFASVQNTGQIITEGTYALIRHPLYFADILLAWCFFLYNASYKTLAVVLWLTIVLVFWANLEERLLEEKFVDEYRDYKKRVPMFIPKWNNK